MLLHENPSANGLWALPWGGLEGQPQHGSLVSLTTFECCIIHMHAHSSSSVKSTREPSGVAGACRLCGSCRVRSGAACLFFSAASM